MDRSHKNIRMRRHKVGIFSKFSLCIQFSNFIFFQNIDCIVQIQEYQQIFWKIVFLKSVLKYLNMHWIFLDEKEDLVV